MSEEGRLKLTREQRKALFDHQGPRIAGDGTCPVRQGQVIDISSKVSLKVLRVNVRRGGGWSLQYELHDRRNVVRNLKRTPRPVDFDALRESFDEHGYPEEPTADVIRQAARESAYSSQPSSMADAGEAVDEQTQDRLTSQASDRFKALKGDDLTRRDLRSSLERLKRLARLQRADGGAVAIIERHIAEIEQELQERAA